MEKQKHPLKPKQRVRLKDGFDEMYQTARSGSVGIVKDVMYDPFGYSCVLIQWDEDHWTYDGEDNGWAYSTHFEPIEEPPMEPKESDELSPEIQEQLTALVKAMIDQERNSRSVKDAPDPADDSDGYDEAIKVAFEELTDSEAFMVIAVKREEDEGVPSLVPEVVSYSRSPEGVLAVEAQIGYLLRMSHEGLVADKLHQILKKDNK